MDRDNYQQGKSRKKRSKSQTSHRNRAITVTTPKVLPVNIEGTLVTKKGKVLEVVTNEKGSNPVSYRSGPTSLRGMFGSTSCLASAEVQIACGLHNTHISPKTIQQFTKQSQAAPPPSTPVWRLPQQISQDLKTIISIEKIQKKNQEALAAQLSSKVTHCKVPPPQLIKPNCDMLHMMNEVLSPSEQLLLDNPGYKMVETNLSSKDVNEIKRMFDIFMLNYELTSIKRVVNPFQLLHYNMRKMLNPCFQEKLLFHGTMVENVDSICLDNFDWRMVIKHKYGCGVSFSTKPYYASFYGDGTEKNRVMFAVKVLVGLEYALKQYEWNIKIPEPPFDTTTDYKKRVYVKYDDCSFYPAYAICYRKKYY